MDKESTPQITDELAAKQPGGDAAEARVAVVGATGFTGALAAKLLWNHPQAVLTTVTGRSDVGRLLSDIYPRYRVPLPVEELSVDQLKGLDVVFVAYPHGAAAPVVRELIATGLRVIDLSADFRLDELEIYRSNYGEHGAPELFGKGVYGIPEIHRHRIKTASLVAVAGCYSTAALLALAPLAREGLIEAAVVDGKSGVSGAGREPTRETHFVAVDENVSPYAVDGHRHHPEMVQELKGLGSKARITFVPHLLPLDQGLLASCYVTPTRPVGVAAMERLYKDAYAGEMFVEVIGRPPGVREVRDTNICRIYVTTRESDGTVVVFAAIDNLWKGAAGQAVQILNIMLGLDEAEGLS